ncbi:hypothetical protein BSL78_14769 [Apostichopus japonicus]|uniref:C2H2-type domain-containing protein n=1 Tax=Stichopus japonicus TaxID=307972 RepID=A0A2G8KK85_STIJA|nr:hypothetical protein BSL78_14769 [Apostichopus japonicus]
MTGGYKHVLKRRSCTYIPIGLVLPTPLGYPQYTTKVTTVRTCTLIFNCLYSWPQCIALSLLHRFILPQTRNIANDRTHRWTWGSYRIFDNLSSQASVSSKGKSGEATLKRRRRQTQIPASGRNPSVSNNAAGRTKTFFLCQFCDRPFSLKSNLKVHERRHTGERPFKCQFCPKTFVSAGEKKTHENFHTGAKPYKCRFCDRGFASTGIRGHHEAKHKQDNPV